MDYSKLSLEELAVRINVAGEDEKAAYLKQCAMLAEIRSRFDSDAKYGHFLKDKGILQNVSRATRRLMVRVDTVSRLCDFAPLTKAQIYVLARLTTDKIPAAYDYIIKNTTVSSTELSRLFAGSDREDKNSNVTKENRVLTNRLLEMLTDSGLIEEEIVRLLGNVVNRVKRRGLADAKYTIKPLRNGLVDIASVVVKKSEPVGYNFQYQNPPTSFNSRHVSM
jgi:hypothetical protein